MWQQNWKLSTEGIRGYHMYYILCYIIIYTYIVMWTPVLIICFIFDNVITIIIVYYLTDWCKERI